jgi:hypothetical protein
MMAIASGSTYKSKIHTVVCRGKIQRTMPRQQQLLKLHQLQLLQQRHLESAARHGRMLIDVSTQHDSKNNCNNDNNVRPNSAARANYHQQSSQRSIASTKIACDSVTMTSKNGGTIVWYNQYTRSDEQPEN